jgi:hypothetical protein
MTWTLPCMLIHILGFRLMTQLVTQGCDSISDPVLLYKAPKLNSERLQKWLWSMDASLVSKQNSAQTFQTVSNTYRSQIVTVY